MENLKQRLLRSTTVIKQSKKCIAGIAFLVCINSVSAQTVVTVNSSDVLTSNNKLVIQSAIAQSFYTGRQAGTTYAHTDGIFRATTDNPNGFQNFYYDGLTGGIRNFYVRADGQAYFAGAIGIGTSVPQFKMHLKFDNDFIGVQRTNTTKYAGTYYLTGPDNAIIYNFFTGLRENSSAYHIYNAQTASDAITVKLENNFVGIGSSNPDAQLTVNGTVHSKSVVIDMNVFADYVFNPQYALPSLSSVSAYIKKYRHLPEIPSEKEVIEKGVDVGEMNRLLVKKVEELTLYLIEQKSEADKQRKINADQEYRIKALKAKLEQLAKKVK